MCAGGGQSGCVRGSFVVNRKPVRFALKEPLPMSDAIDVMDAAFEQYAIGQPVPRKEDPPLVQGKGLFADDADHGWSSLGGRRSDTSSE